MAFDNNWKLLFIVSLGIFLRYSFRFSAYYGEIFRRVEVSSPVNAWIRVIEGVTLKHLNQSPYDGDTFHESPIFLRFYQMIVNYLNEFQIAILFIVIDILTAFILAKAAMKQLKSMQLDDLERLKQHLSDKDDKKHCENLLIKPDWIEKSAQWIISIYALSPYSILPCVAQSTSVWNNFLMALILLNATNGQRIITLLLLALNCLNTFYSLILLPGVILVLEQSINAKQVGESKTSEAAIKNLSQSSSPQSIYNKNSIIFSLLIFLSSTFYLLAMCVWLEGGSFQFINSTYVFMWTVSDLTPNIGVFWYFFAEMFDHFRSFFLWVFQINYFIYIVPLTLKLRYNPYFLCMIALINHSIFKPYPTVSDFIFYICLLPQWAHLFGFMKSTLVVSGTIATTSVLAPILWYLWIVLGTANSNFYFGITLAFNLGQIFLITDLIFAFIKREFYIKNINLYKLCKKLGKSPRIELAYK